MYGDPMAYKIYVIQLNHFRAKANFFEYLDVVKDAMDGASPGCASAVKNAMK